MAVINYSKKEISAKIVYYGPSLCGKTTNIQSIYASVKPEQKGKLVSLATEADRTLFFDFLPIEIANIRGFKTRLHFYTVPGQVYYNSTRRAVLTGVDGLVFVADSQRDKMEENIESLNNLEENLNYYGKSIKTIPMVMQYNKRDLPDVIPISEIDQLLNQYGYPSFEAVATTGEGVLETLTKITKMVLQHIEMGTSGKQQRTMNVMPEKISASLSASQPLSTQRPSEPSVARPVEDPRDASVQRSHEPPQAKGVSEQDSPMQRPSEPSATKSVEAPRDASVQRSHELPKATGVSEQESPMHEESEPLVALPLESGIQAGRIHIVGTENAEIISTNAVQLPVHVKIEGDTKIYRIDLAIKLDGFKLEE